MTLTTARQKYRDVTEQTIPEVFADDSLRGEFAILEADENTFLQIGGEGGGPYKLEFKDAGNQFQCVRRLTKEEAKEAFLDYLRGDAAWRTKNEWKEAVSPKGCLGQAGVLLLLGAIPWVLSR
jgi:hypothetical protein